jgi:hypothetical protein
MAGLARPFQSFDLDSASQGNGSEAAINTRARARSRSAIFVSYIEPRRRKRGGESASNATWRRGQRAGEEEEEEEEEHGEGRPGGAPRRRQGALRQRFLRCVSAWVGLPPLRARELRSRGGVCSWLFVRCPFLTSCCRRCSCREAGPLCDHAVPEPGAQEQRRPRSALALLVFLLIRRQGSGSGRACRFFLTHPDLVIYLSSNN